MKKIFLTAIVSAIFMFNFASVAFCESQTVKGAKQDLELFKKDMAVRLENLDKKIHELKNSAKDKGRTISKNTINELEEAKSQLKMKIDSMKDDGKSSWESLKGSIATSFDDLNNKIQSALK